MKIALETKNDGPLNIAGNGVISFINTDDIVAFGKCAIGNHIDTLVTKDSVYYLSETRGQIKGLSEALFAKESDWVTLEDITLSIPQLQFQSRVSQRFYKAFFMKKESISVISRPQLKGAGISVCLNTGLAVFFLGKDEDIMISIIRDSMSDQLVIASECFAIGMPNINMMSPHFVGHTLQPGMAMNYGMQRGHQWDPRSDDLMTDPE